MTEPAPLQAANTAMAKLAERLSANPVYMASALHAFQVQERLDADALARLLGISPDGLTRLALCKRPKSDIAEFAGQVRQIAAYVGLDPARLAQLVRQVEAVETAKAFGKSLKTTAAEEAAAPSTASMLPGWLAAARDRDEADSDSDQKSGEGPDHEEPEP